MDSWIFQFYKNVGVGLKDPRGSLPTWAILRGYEAMSLQTCFSFLHTGSLHKSTPHTVTCGWAGGTNMAQIRQKQQELARLDLQPTPSSRTRAAAPRYPQAAPVGPTAVSVGLLLQGGLGQHNIIASAGAALD